MSFWFWTTWLHLQKSRPSENHIILIFLKYLNLATVRLQNTAEQSDSDII